MKQIVCEVCGSNDLVKEDGCFICQYCGAKYSPEEAKRLIVEVNDKVDVSGSKVTVDNTSFVERSLENARRAKAKEDWEECEKYYNMVEQYEPTNIEAIFYSSYGKARMALVDSDRFKREQKIKVLKNSISVIDDNYDMFVELSLGMIESIEHIIHTIPDKYKTTYLWKIIRQQYAYIYSVCRKTSYRHNYKNKRQWLDSINRVDEKLKQLDPNYLEADLEELPRTTNEVNAIIAAAIVIIMIIVLVIYYISQSM